MGFGDTLPRAAFGGVEFPYTRFSVRGSARLVTHVYLRRPGGEIEKLARNLYEISFECPFHEVFKKYPGLWPTRLATLRGMWEQLLTKPLVIPTVGTIDAVAATWDQEFMARIKSGENVRVSYLEDASKDFLVDSLVIAAPSTLAGLMKQLDTGAFDSGLSLGIFDTLRNAINSVTAIADTAELYASGLDAKIQSVLDAVDRLDRRVTALQTPGNWPLMDTLHEIGGTAVGLKNDLLGQSVPIDTFTTPVTMSVSQISQRIYGVTSRASQIMKLNSFNNPLAVKANTQVRHYIA